ncbi:MAG: VWA domain-containing protein [Gammaproteobacteria bacterium]|jgi:Ca-activated chloride channel family protein|nr:VWA domain-containing protein [Gammaproteobacteria bacterium]
MIETLQFLRPVWLIALPAITLIWWLVRRREASRAEVGDIVAPHLRAALTVNRNARNGLRAVDGVCIAAISAALAAAGPTWSKQPSPWFTESAPLIIAIEVSDSMRSNDSQPTRLDRARFKVMDLVAARTGSRTALIAYAGSAHIVVPPSTDADVLQPFLESLDPAIMPAAGSQAGGVLPLARSLLGDRAAAGTLLFVNDGFDSSDIAPLANFALQPDMPSLAALVIGSDEGGVAFMPDGSPVMAATGGRLDTRIDPALLRRLAAEAKMSVVRSGIGDADIRQLLRTIQSNLRLADDPDAAWRDQGWWLLWPATLLALLWFRRGWTMRW